MKIGWAIARNADERIPRGVALCIELAADGSVPEWIQLLPSGPEIKGRDGRAWLHDRASAVVAAFAAEGKDVVIDFEHSTEIKAPQGDEAPAAGWIKEMEIRNGGEIWGRIEWTARAAEAIRNREYRYISPVFIYEIQTGRITRIVSAGLTNKPNLQLAALNAETHQRKENNMELAQLLAALGLPATATFAEALNRITAMRTELGTALNRADNPPLDKFVPRADYDQALNRATTAETKLKAKTDADLETAINTEIAAALKAGKITPATAEYHKAQCRTEGGLDRFKTFVAAAPVIGDATGLDGKKPAGDGKAIDEGQKAINAMCGVDDETFKKYGPKGE